MVLRALVQRPLICLFPPIRLCTGVSLGLVIVLLFCVTSYINPSDLTIVRSILANGGKDASPGFEDRRHRLKHP